jgi:hypothetical protein
MDVGPGFVISFNSFVLQLIFYIFFCIVVGDFSVVVVDVVFTHDTVAFDSSRVWFIVEFLLSLDEHTSFNSFPFSCSCSCCDLSFPLSFRCC